MKKTLKRIRRGFLLAAFAVLSLTPFTAHAEEEEYKPEWVQEGDDWLYFVGETQVAVGWRQIGKNWYYFSEDGIMQTGWIKDEGLWYYLKANGAMATGWQKIGGQYYYFDSDGIMASNEYRGGYWLTKSGAWDKGAQKAGWRKNASGWWYYDRGWYPRNRWLWIDGKCYHFDAKGYLSVDTRIGDDYVDENGVWSSEWGYEYPKHDDVYKNTWKTKMRGRKPDITMYSYEVIPLVESFNECFYIMTDNPDPNSFAFIDKSSKYEEDCDEGEVPYIYVSTANYADVVYENAETFRVAGGYIAYGRNVDGGELTLCTRYLNPSDEFEVWLGGGYKMAETEITVTTPKLLGFYDYLLETYTTDGADFFTNMDALQSGLSSICLYSGVSVLGTLQFSEEYPYYGISNSPHNDQNFYIQEPYYRTDGKSMLMSALYPYRLDSLGFPSVMGSLAKMLDENAQVEWDSYSHYTVHVTHDGETRSYGGAGHGGGQQILEDQILYRYRFDGSKNDAAQNITMKGLYRQLNEYGALEVDTEAGKTIPRLTWDEVKETVGDGAYVSILYLMLIGAADEPVFSYMYDDGTRGDGMNGFVNIGHLTNAWFDGRFFTVRETFYKGISFEETLDGIVPDLVFKDMVIKLPEDGREYTTRWGDPLEGYDKETGIWKGYTTFTYDEDSENWIAGSIRNSVYYKGEDGEMHPLETEEFLDATTITLEEAKSMNLDRNKDVDPTEYYVYDKKTPPGTLVSN